MKHLFGDSLLLRQRFVEGGEKYLEGISEEISLLFVLLLLFPHGKNFNLSQAFLIDKNLYLISIWHCTSKLFGIELLHELDHFIPERDFF